MTKPLQRLHRQPGQPLIRGTNDWGRYYGPATGNTVDVPVIANCVSLENEIFLEHVLDTNSSLLQQLGIDLEDAAQQMASAAPTGWPRAWPENRSGGAAPESLRTSSLCGRVRLHRSFRGNLWQ
jgi:hypothetical protein